MQFRDRDFAGGANVPSLREAHETFRRIGASEPRLLEHARPPRPEERGIRGDSASV